MLEAGCQLQQVLIGEGCGTGEGKGVGVGEGC